jgi:hypothetical protein
MKFRFVETFAPFAGSRVMVLEVQRDSGVWEPADKITAYICEAKLNDEVIDGFNEQSNTAVKGGSAGND